MQTLQIVVVNLAKAKKLAKNRNVKIDELMVGEVFSGLANISGVSNDLIDFINDFYTDLDVRHYYINEIWANIEDTIKLMMKIKPCDM